MYQAECHFAADKPAEFYSSLGLAISNDKGRSFRKPGLVIRPALPPEEAVRTPSSSGSLVVYYLDISANRTCDGQPSGFGVTPTTITIRRNAGDCVLKVSKAGFEEMTFPIVQGVNPAYWSNMVFAPLAPAGAFVAAFSNDSQGRLAGLGFVAVGAAAISTDFITGAVHAHKPSKIDAVLKPK